MRIEFSEFAWEQYVDLQKSDKKTLGKINLLIKSMSRTPFEGPGQPEALKHDLSGFWSRRIDSKNRIIYRIFEERCIIIQCGAHYSDK